MPASLPAVAPYVLLLAALLCGGIWLGSRLSGWSDLAQSYASSSPFDGPLWSPCFGVIQRSWFWRYNMQLKVGVDRRGLYLKLWPFSLPFYPPLFFPWPDVSADWSLYWFARVQFAFREQPGVKIRLTARVARKIVEAAGQAWPTGQFLFPGRPER